MDGRNQPFLIWIILSEHACVIGTEIVWTKNEKGVSWPALRMLRSGIELIGNLCSLLTIQRDVNDTVANAINSKKGKDKPPSKTFLEAAQECDQRVGSTAWVQIPHGLISRKSLETRPILARMLLKSLPMHLQNQLKNQIALQKLGIIRYRRIPL